MALQRPFLFRNRHHYILLACTLACALACLVLMFRVNVNSDMTKYLPSDSQMKEGIAIVSEEFGAQQLTSASIRVMVPGLNEQERDSVKRELQTLEDISGVSYRASEDGHYTLFSLQAPDSVNQKAIGRTIRKSLGEATVVETSQDGATPPFSVIVIAAAMIIFVLVLMAQSWLDPVIFLLSAGVAILLNIGTNALLPSVSITTNYIGAILQLVLSLDFSIVLLNRYRQELSDDRTPTESVNAAIKRAMPPIMSSASTTILGLLMLSFMRLKIGMDMGVVLAKGVVCSLICTFTVLPSLLMLFRKGIAYSSKKTFVLPTDGLSNFVTRHKTPLAICAIVLFFVSWWYSRKTDIYFCTNGQSEIAEVFPSANPYVIIYDPADEQAIIPLVDSLATLPGATSVISYPSLLMRQYSAEGLFDYLKDMQQSMADFIPAGATDNLPQDLLSSEVLSPDMLRVLFYMRSGAGDTLRIEFPAMMRFVLDNCADNPLLANYIPEEMHSQMDLLRVLIEMPEEVEQPAPVDTLQWTDNGPMKADWEKPEEIVAADKLAELLPSSAEQEEPALAQLSYEETDTTTAVAAPVIDTIPVPESKPIIDQMAITPFIALLAAENDGDEAYYLSQLVNKSELHREMKIDEMSDYIGSSRQQTRMVYSMCGSPIRMTPLRYVHFLVDDLFNRKSLQKFVTAEQKADLINVMHIMTAADEETILTSAQLAELINNYGLPFTQEDAQNLMNPRTEPSAPIVTVSEDPDLLETRPILMPVVAMKEPVVQPKPRKRKIVLSEAEIIAQHFDRLLHSEQAFSAEEMAANFQKLGQHIDTPTVGLLYTYYGCITQYDSTLTMSPEQLLNYLADTLIEQPTLSQLINEDERTSLLDIRSKLVDGMSMLSNDKHAVLLTLTNLPAESDETYAFTERVTQLADTHLSHPHYLVGESVMYSEMKNGFAHEMLVVTLLTVLAIFLIVAISFRSLVVPTILVMTVMTAVYVNVVFSGLMSGKMLYLAYLIVQSILMGATIDYGILLTNYYKEYRKTMPRYEACKEAYRGSIRTIMTSGLIMAVAPGIMALMVDDVAISSIVGCLSIGAMVAIALILTALPAILVALDRWVVRGSKSVPDNN